MQIFCRNCYSSNKVGYISIYLSNSTKGRYKSNFKSLYFIICLILWIIVLMNILFCHHLNKTIDTHAENFKFSALFSLQLLCKSLSSILITSVLYKISSDFKCYSITWRWMGHRKSLYVPPFMRQMRNSVLVKWIMQRSTQLTAYVYFLLI